jgi:hypothetical protein
MDAIAVAENYSLSFLEGLLPGRNKSAAPNLLFPIHGASLTDES